MKTSEKREGYSGIFLERSGKDAREMAEKLLDPPESPLNEVQKQEVYNFETWLASFDTGNGTLIEVLKKHKGPRTTAPRFFAEAFLSGSIKVPDGVELSEFSNSDDVFKWLAVCARDGIIDEAALRKMALASTKHYEKQMIDYVVSGSEPPDSIIESKQIVINPTKSVLMAKSIFDIREHLIDLRQKYKKSDDLTGSAKCAIVEIYQSKINSIAVNDLAVMQILSDQSEMIGDIETRRVATQLIPPVLKSALETSDNRLLQRLDYLENGMGTDESGRATVVDEEVIEGKEQLAKSEKGLHPVYTEQEKKKLESFTVLVEEMQQIFRQVLDKAGLLSSEDSSTWTPDRGRRAKDELYQVVINPKATNFAADGTTGAFLVAPEPQSLFKLISTGSHEFEHINQQQGDRQIGKVLRIAEVKGKRTDMLRESGANRKQREVEEKLFGSSKPIALTYAAALQTLEDGGSLFQATRAFYLQKRTEFPGINPEVAAEEAADRVLRIIRNGRISSGQMSYSEELIMDYELKDSPKEVKDRAMAVTSFDLVDQIRLHKYDLLPHEVSKRVEWTPILLDVLEPYIKKALDKS